MTTLLGVAREAYNCHNACPRSQGSHMRSPGALLPSHERTLPRSMNVMLPIGSNHDQRGLFTDGLYGIRVWTTMDRTKP